ncbi:MAG: CHASE2 domain-containing protein [Crocosphaera sp.]
MLNYLKKVGLEVANFCENWQAVLVTAPTITAIVLGVNQLGVLQVLEWAAYDQWFRLRPQQPASQRITIVTIDEEDLTQLNQWPLSDQIIAQTLNTLKDKNARVIALDIYRDLVVKPGHEELAEVFETTPNLIGVEKVSGRPVAPPPILAEKKQVGLADLVIDSDSKVRRALLSVRRKDDQEEGGQKIQLSLGTQAALKYLEKKDITLQPVSEENSHQLQLGKAVFSPLSPNSGGYVNADTGGYQILLNYRGVHEEFATISLQDLLNNNFDPNLISDRIVFIGSIAESLNDQFYTPFSSVLDHQPSRIGGVVIHANISSQIISAALEGRPLMKVVPESLEWKIIFISSLLASIVTWKLVVSRSRQHKIYSFISLLMISLGVPSVMLLGIAYYLFLNGWWIPIIAPGLSIFLSVFSIPIYNNFSLFKMASIDGLTSLYNRRYFDNYLDQLWEEYKYRKLPLSIILCDVDYFKKYNDRYGHPEGDKCLQKVSEQIQNTVRRKTDLAARYGGEEFVVLLPNANPKKAREIADNICDQIRLLELEHQGSEISDHVTISCGSASMVPDDSFTPKALINRADKALYQAKEAGRNCAYHNYV